jgi:acetyl esterase/lipase
MPLGFLTVNTAASFGPYSRQTNLTYGPAVQNKADLYLPLGSGPAPVVIFFYGGGWTSGDKASYKFVGAALAEAGYVAVLPNYSLYPKARFPVFMQDAAQAVAWARAHARAWGGDPDRIYLIGHSAGAHIAVLLALDPKYLQEVGGSPGWLRGVVGLAGPYDFLPFRADYFKDLFGPPANFPRSQPINYVRADAPPLLLIQGMRDETVSPSNTQQLTAALQTVGGHVSTEYFDRAGHADVLATLSPAFRSRLPVLADIRAFIASGASTPWSPSTGAMAQRANAGVQSEPNTSSAHP